MAGVVVRRGSEEAPPWFFRQRFLGFLALLLLALARSASAGVLTRERTDDDGNRGRDYSRTARSYGSSNQWNGIRLNVSIVDYGWQRPDDSRTRDRGNLFTSNSNKYYNYDNYGNDIRGSTSTGVADKGKYDDTESLIKNYNNSLDEEDTLNLLKGPSVKTPDSFPKHIPIYFIMFLFLLCIYASAHEARRKEKEQEARERPQVLMRSLVPVQRPPAAEDEPETQDQDTEAPPTYSDVLKSESPPTYSEVCAEET